MFHGQELASLYIKVHVFILLKSQGDTVCGYGCVQPKKDADNAAKPSPDCVVPWAFLTIAPFSGPIKILSRAPRDKCTHISTTMRDAYQV